MLEALYTLFPGKPVHPNTMSISLAHIQDVRSVFRVVDGDRQHTRVCGAGVPRNAGPETAVPGAVRGSDGDEDVETISRAAPQGELRLL